MAVEFQKRSRGEEIEDEEENGLISQILDPDNTDPIILQNDDGEDVEFEQVALVPYDDELFTILKPITKVQGVSEDEAVVFRIDYIEDEEEFYLNVETEQAVLDEVYKVYENLFLEAQANQ